MEEIWKPVAVKGFESKYEVSNLGRVKSSGVLMLTTWHILWARLWNSIVRKGH